MVVKVKGEPLWSKLLWIVPQLGIHVGRHEIRSNACPLSSVHTINIIATMLWITLTFGTYIFYACHSIASHNNDDENDDNDNDLWQSVAVDMDVFHGHMHQTSRGGATDSQNLIDCCLVIRIFSKEIFLNLCWWWPEDLWLLKTWPCYYHSGQTPLHYAEVVMEDLVFKAILSQSVTFTF